MKGRDRTQERENVRAGERESGSDGTIRIRIRPKEFSRIEPLNRREGIQVSGEHQFAATRFRGRIRIKIKRPDGGHTYLGGGTDCYIATTLGNTGESEDRNCYINCYKLLHEVLQQKG
jgi:hypothetical protein